MRSDVTGNKQRASQGYKWIGSTEFIPKCVCVATDQHTRLPTVIWSHYIQCVARTSHWTPLLCNSSDVILVRCAGLDIHAINKIMRACVFWPKLHTQFSACNCVVSLCAAVCSLVLQDPHSKLFSPRTLIPLRQFCCIGVGWPTSSFRYAESEIMLSWHFPQLADIKCTHIRPHTAAAAVYHMKMLCRQSLTYATF